MKTFNYGFKFLYREMQGSEQKTDYIMFSSTDPNIVNACEIAMLRFIKSHNYYSGKIIKTILF